LQLRRSCPLEQSHPTCRPLTNLPAAGPIHKFPNGCSPRPPGLLVACIGKGAFRPTLQVRKVTKDPGFDLMVAFMSLSLGESQRLTGRCGRHTAIRIGLQIPKSVGSLRARWFLGWAIPPPPPPPPRQRILACPGFRTATLTSCTHLVQFVY